MFPVDAEPTGAVGAVVDRDRRTEELTAEIRDVASQSSRLQARQAELVGGLEEVYVGEITLSHWIGWQVGLMPAEARRTLGLARRLAKLPVLRGAFAEGRLSEGTLATLVSVATPDNEAELLDTSQVTTGAQLTRPRASIANPVRPVWPTRRHSFASPVGSSARSALRAPTSSIATR